MEDYGPSNITGGPAAMAAVLLLLMALAACGPMLGESTNLGATGSGDNVRYSDVQAFPAGSKASGD
jgi:hypothetical protein